MKIEKRNAVDTLIIFLILLIAFVLSFQTLYKIGLWCPGDSTEIYFGYNLINRGISKNYVQGHGFFSTPIIPFLLIFGYTKFALRFAQSFFLTLTILITYLIGIILFNKKTALIISLILSISPFFVLQSLADFPEMTFLIMLPLLLFLKYIKTGENKFLYFSFLVLGLGTSVKLIIFYFFLSLLIPLIFIKLFFKSKTEWNLSAKQIIMLFIFFILGTSPLIYAEINYGFPLMRSIKENFIQTRIGYENFNLPRNGLNRWYDLNLVFMCPNPLMCGYGDSLNPLGNYRYILTFHMLLFSFLYLILFGERKDYFILSLIPLFIFFIIFVPTHSIFPHIFPIFPLFAIVMGRTLIMVSKKRVSLVILFLLLFAVLNLHTILQVNEILDNEVMTEELFPRLAKVHSLVPKYVENASTVVTAFYFEDDYLNSQFLGRKKVIIIPEDFRYGGYVGDSFITKRNETIDVFNKTMDDSNVLYVLPSPSRNKQERQIYSDSCSTPNKEENLCDVLVELLKLVANQKNKTLELKDVINDTAGKEVYLIYRVI